MNDAAPWLLAGATAGLVAVGEIWLLLAARRGGEARAGAAHAALRDQWFAAVSEHVGSEILAVQTLRNGIMAASMLASATALALMGTVTLLAQSGRAGAAGVTGVEPRLAMEWLLLLLLFASLVAAVVAARYFNHASFIGGMPVGSPARRRWAAVGSAYVRTAGHLYGWALRQLVLIAPPLSFILEPASGPLMALLALAVLLGFDRFDPRVLEPAGTQRPSPSGSDLGPDSAPGPDQ